MHGDFSRWTFDAKRRYRRVLQQQGRVLLDADWNELNAILLDEMQTLARDVIGPHGGPADNLGFEIVLDPANFTFKDDQTNAGNPPKIAPKDAVFYIGSGHYWVEGLLVTLDSPTTFRTQPHPLPTQSDAKPPVNMPADDGFVIYLEVWEREYTEWDDPLLRETALLGPDTCFRSRLVWQVKAEAQGWVNLKTPADQKIMGDLVEAWTRAHRWPPQRVRAGATAAAATFPPGPAPRLQAGVTEPPNASDPCILPADAKYRGRENQLYRIEVHQGSALDAAGAIVNDNVTFKWSRDNGSVTFPLLRLEGGAATVAHLGRDARTTLSEGDVVEVLDDALILNGDPGPLATVKTIDPDESLVTLTFAGTNTPRYENDSPLHPFLRRWDFASGLEKNGYALSLSDALAKELPIEAGIWIQLAPDPTTTGPPFYYRTGNYWTIPARTETGSIEWPRESDGAWSFAPPSGIVRHYAPIALLQGGVLMDFRITLS